MAVPLGIFWDIENCQVPRNKSAKSVVKKIRELLEEKHPECGFPNEFICVCDIGKVDKRIQDELGRTEVLIVHVSLKAKNAADDKLQELIEKFSLGKDKAVICLITGDVNFLKTVRNSRLKNLDVVLIYCQKNYSTELVDCAKETYVFEDVIKEADNFNKKEARIETS